MFLRDLVADTSLGRRFHRRCPDVEPLRDRIGFSTECLIKPEVGAATGTGFGEKGATRRAQRNGYRDRHWETRAMTVQRRIPKLRNGSCFQGFLDPRPSSRSRFLQPPGGLRRTCYGLPGFFPFGLAGLTLAQIGLLVTTLGPARATSPFRLHVSSERRNWASAGRCRGRVRGPVTRRLGVPRARWVGLDLVRQLCPAPCKPGRRCRIRTRQHYLSLCCLAQMRYKYSS